MTTTQVHSGVLCLAPLGSIRNSALRSSPRPTTQCVRRIVRSPHRCRGPPYLVPVAGPWARPGIIAPGGVGQAERHRHRHRHRRRQRGATAHPNSRHFDQLVAGAELACTTKPSLTQRLSGVAIERTSTHLHAAEALLIAHLDAHRLPSLLPRATDLATRAMRTNSAQRAAVAPFDVGSPAGRPSVGRLGCGVRARQRGR